jgi:hypothetical protein
MTHLPSAASRLLRPALVAAALLFPLAAAQAAPAGGPAGLSAPAGLQLVHGARWGSGWGAPPPARWGRHGRDEWRWRHRWRQEQARRWRHEEIRREEARRRAMYRHRGWDGGDWY